VFVCASTDCLDPGFMEEGFEPRAF
jgi:hypothetical protein